MTLFVVNTISQLINAIVIAKTEYKDKECDLYYKESLYIDHKKLCDEVFNKCYPYPKLNISGKGFFYKIKKTLKFEELNNNICVDYKDYDNIFISSKSIFLIQIYYAAKIINPDLELNLYEEGAYEYCELEEKIRWKEFLYSYLIYHRYYLCDCKYLYVYRPDLIRNRWRNISIKRIANLYEHKDIIDRIRDSFGKNTALVSVEKGSIVFFDQEDDERLDEFQKYIVREITSIVDLHRMYIKPHPRSQTQKYGNLVNYINSSSPFELSITDDKLENMIFITICSSAAINISLMSEKKPVIIYLYNLYNFNNRTNDCLNSFIKRNLLSEERNVFAPLTETELKDCIRRVCC